MVPIFIAATLFSCMTISARAASLEDFYTSSTAETLKPIERSSAVYDQSQSQQRKNMKKMNDFQSVLSLDWLQTTFGLAAKDAQITLDNHRQNEEINKERPKLQYTSVLPDDQIGLPYHDAVEVGYAWLYGFRPWNFWTNTTACFDRMTNYTYYEVPALSLYIDDESHTGFEVINETLYVVRNLSEHLWECNAAWNSSSHYWKDQSESFNGFGHFFLSALQNFLGEVISLTNVYISIEDNYARNNTYGVHYDTARLFRILAIFEPIELIERDLEYNPNDSDADSIPDPDVSTEIPQLRRTNMKKRKDNGFLVNIVRYIFDNAIDEKVTTQPIRAPKSSARPQSKFNSTTPQVEGIYLDFIEAMFGDKVKGEIEDFQTFEDILEIFFGFTNATQLTFGENRTVCQSAVENLWYKSQDSVDIATRDWFNYFDLPLAVEAFLYVPHNLYTLQTSCMESVVEVNNLADTYRAIWQSAQDIQFNIFFNGGSIISAVTNIVMYFVVKEYSSVDTSFELGMELGRIFWMLFYPARDYLADSVDQGFTWGEDYTWDDVIGKVIPDSITADVATVVITQ